LGQGLANGGR